MYIVITFSYFSHFLDYSSQNESLHPNKNLQIHIRIQFITLNLWNIMCLQIKNKMLQHEF